MALDDAVGTLLSGQDDHGHAPAGIGATPSEVEVVVAAAGLWGLEAVVLFPVCHHAIDGSLVGPVHALDIDWGEQVFGDDALAQAGDAAAFHLVDAALFECYVVLVSDARILLDRWNVREDLDVVTTIGSFARIRAGRRDHIECRVVWQLLLVENGLEVLVLVLRVEEVVVSQLLVDSVGANVQNDSRAGGCEFFEFVGEAFLLPNKCL